MKLIFAIVASGHVLGVLSYSKEEKYEYEEAARFQVQETRDNGTLFPVEQDDHVEDPAYLMPPDLRRPHHAVGHLLGRRDDTIVASPELGTLAGPFFISQFVMHSDCINFVDEFINF